jgi:protein gp37
MWGSDHIFLVLTKRAQRLAQNAPQFPSDPINVWHGLTVCNQQEADEKIPQLLQVPGHKWLSLEPLLSLILIPQEYLKQIDAVVVGCETGPRRRYCPEGRIRAIVDQCKAAGVLCFVKQIEVNGKVVHELEQFPKDLRVRELPWRAK